MKMAHGFLMAGCLLPAGLMAHDEVGNLDQSNWGLVKEAPIEVCMPTGQREYLERLICPGQEHPLFVRAGNVGPRAPLPENGSEAQLLMIVLSMPTAEPLAEGAADHHWIDAYEVDCGGEKTMVYMDMYHCDAPPPTAAPAGFMLKN